MKFSIVIPSYLGPYRHAARDRHNKLLRAVQSVLLQSYQEIEGIVIADGCKETEAIIKAWFRSDLLSGKLRLIKIEKQDSYSGVVRNTGINLSTGEWICYLDADDILEESHVETISSQVGSYDWVFFNDLILKNNLFHERLCDFKFTFCGTSNIAHKKSMKARWLLKNKYGYDDWNFIQELQKESQNYARINTPGYIVCHIPYRRGYDV